MLAVELPVVGGEDDVGVVELAEPLELVDEVGDAPVDVQQGLELALVALLDAGRAGRTDRPERPDRLGLVADVGLVVVRRSGQGLPLERAHVLRRGHRAGGAPPGAPLRNLVRRGVGDVEVEGLVRRGVARDEVQRLAGHHVTLVVRGRAAVRYDRPVLVELVVVDLLFVRERCVPLVPAWRDQRRVAKPVAVEVLADLPRAVAGRLQPDRERVGRVEELEPRARGHPMVVGVLTGEIGRARGTAEREVDEEVAESRALVGE